MSEMEGGTGLAEERVRVQDSELDLGLHWRNSFARLGADFYTALPPRPLPNPYWVARSDGAAHELGLPRTWAEASEALAAFSGNRSIAGTRPLASVYSGHQFGVWAGQLGDAVARARHAEVAELHVA